MGLLKVIIITYTSQVCVFFQYPFTLILKLQNTFSPIQLYTKNQKIIIKNGRGIPEFNYQNKRGNS